MKKLLSVLLVALLVLNLAACAKKAEPATEEPEIEVAVATPAPAAEDSADGETAAEAE